MMILICISLVYRSGGGAGGAGEGGGDGTDEGSECLEFKGKVSDDKI